MSKAVTSGQARSLIGSFTVDTPWEGLEAEVQSFIQLPPAERGERFAAFIRNGLRLSAGALVTLVNRIKNFKPAVFIGEGWKIWRGTKDGNGLEGEEAQYARSLALAEIDWSKVTFPTCLKEGETSITGEVKCTRLTESGKILLDAKVGQTLFEDYKLNGENSVLERLHRERGISYLDFFGTVLRNPLGNRYVLFLVRVDGGWDWRVSWLDYHWLRRHGSAILD